MAYRDWETILQYVASAVEHGDSAKQIAEYLGLKVKELSRQLNRMKKRGVEVPDLHIPKPCISEDNRWRGRQKPDEYWAEMRSNVIQWLQQNVSREVIAERIGVQVQSLSNKLHRWRKEGHPIPVAVRGPRKEVTVRMIRKQETEQRKAARVLKKQERQKKWTERKPAKRIIRPEKKVEKRLPDRHIDTSAMKFVRVNDKTLIQVPLDRDEQEAITEWKSRHNKYK